MIWDTKTKSTDYKNEKLKKKHKTKKNQQQKDEAYINSVILNGLAHVFLFFSFYLLSHLFILHSYSFLKPINKMNLCVRVCVCRHSVGFSYLRDNNSTVQCNIFKWKCPNPIGRVIKLSYFSVIKFTIQMVENRVTFSSVALAILFLHMFKTFFFLRSNKPKKKIKLWNEWSEHHL